MSIIFLFFFSFFGLFVCIFCDRYLPVAAASAALPLSAAVVVAVTAAAAGADDLNDDDFLQRLCYS